MKLYALALLLVALPGCELADRLEEPTVTAEEIAWLRAQVDAEKTATAALPVGAERVGREAALALLEQRLADTERRQQEQKRIPWWEIPLYLILTYASGRMGADRLVTRGAPLLLRAFAAGMIQRIRK